MEGIEKLKQKYPAKQEFIERIEKLIGKKDAEKFFEIVYTSTPDSIRVNTLKISCEELKKRLEDYNWKIKQPFSDYPEIMIIDQEKGRKLEAGELGKTKEHLLGYYYVQEISSMLPILTLNPKEDELLLDLCASPGSKTSQAAGIMNNKGTIIANDNNLGRIRILTSNLEKLGVSNVIVTRKDGVQLCRIFKNKSKIRFDKILVDAPCSGEGTLRKSPKTFQMWNLKFLRGLSKIQKKLAGEALKILKVGGEMVYSTCTLSPEENESVIDYLTKNFDIKVEEINLPIKMRCGVCEWEGENYNEQVKKACRLYPQDNDTNGFFLCKLIKLSEKGCDIQK